MLTEFVNGMKQKSEIFVQKNVKKIPKCANIRILKSVGNKSNFYFICGDGSQASATGIHSFASSSHHLGTFIEDPIWSCSFETNNFFHFYVFVALGQKNWEELFDALGFETLI